MTLQELHDLAKAKNLYPININGDPDPEIKNLFIGTLVDYFCAVSFLGAKCVFIQNSVLESSEFIYEVQVCRDEEDDEEEPKEIDLSLVNPALASLKKHIGSCDAFLLSAKIDGYSLNKYLEEEWRNSFIVEQEKAIESVDKDQEKAFEKMERLKIN